MSASVPTPRSRVCHVVADALAEAGAECVFGVMGEDIAPLIVAAAARGIDYHSVRHENQAVAMADGYARASGRTGFAAVTGGPGFCNALTAINTAHRAGSRVVVMTGAGRPQEDDNAPGVIRHTTPASWLKHFPHAAALKLLGIPVVKPATVAGSAGEARFAFAQGRHGTVVLVLGRSLLLEDAVTVDDDFDDDPAEPAPRTPDPEKILTLADFLQQTWAVSRPLILAGRGAVVSGAAPSLARLGEITGSVLATTLRATGLFNGDPYDLGVCGTYATPVASDLITRADCVLAFGAGLNHFTTYGNTLFPTALVIQVDHDEAAIGRFVDVELGIHGDARVVADRLVNELERRAHVATGFRAPETRELIESYRTGDGVVDESTATLIDPRTLMLELDRILPHGRILCADAGQHARFAVRYIRVQRPENFIQAVDAGSVGLGIGTGIGAAIARPRELVVVAVGDGGMMMSLGDLETAIRLRLPILVVVTNDEALGAEVNVLSDLGMDPRLAQTPSPSFEAIATAMGARAATIRSTAELHVIEHWLRDHPTRPLVLDCRVNPEIRAH